MWNIQNQLGNPKQCVRLNRCTKFKEKFCLNCTIYQRIIYFAVPFKLIGL